MKYLKRFEKNNNVVLGTLYLPLSKRVTNLKKCYILSRCQLKHHLPLSTVSIDLWNKTFNYYLLHYFFYLNLGGQKDRSALLDTQFLKFLYILKGEQSKQD